MFQLVSEGFVNVLQWSNILLIFAGVLVGIVFGAIPGLAADLGVILLLPLTFSMDPISGILLLLGVYCGGTYGGSISSILIGVPGTNVSMATIFDGYPLAKNGHPRKALSMALISSTIGGIISALLLLFAAPFIAKYVLSFGPPEYFMLAIFGLSIIAGVSGDSLLRGIIMACIGYFVSIIGIDGASGAARYTFNNIYLMKGLGLLPVLLGVFALPNIFNNITTRAYKQKFSVDIKLGKKDIITKQEFKKCIPVISKSVIIGSIIGAIPGAGAAIASLMSYNEAKRTSKKPELFGTGVLEGIAAPESANNAVTGTSLIPLFTFGIPGSIVAALLIGAFTMHGLIPGPMLFKTQAPLMYTIMAGFLICNIAMFIEGRYLLRGFSQLAKVPQPLLFTGLMLFCVAGAFSYSNAIFNVYVLIVVGIIMYLLAKIGFNGAPFILGLILGPLAESSLKNSLVMSDGSFMIFLQRPICVVIMALTVFFTLYTMRKTKSIKKENVDKLSKDDLEKIND